ncbi:MAG TPA: chromate transporter [Anaeromyxobacter sp.]
MTAPAHPAAETGLSAGERAEPPLAILFLVFLKVGAFAFGGVYSMLPFLERELVHRRRWLTADALAEAIAVGQLTPGPPIVNTGAFVGQRLRGTPGALVATLGQILPGLALVLVLATAYQAIRSAPVLAGALRGVGAAAVGLLASVALRMGRRVIDGTAAALLALAAFALLALGRVNPFLVLALSGLAGYVAHGRRR